MSLIRKNNNIELYAVPNQHWIVTAEYPFYQDLEKLFDFTNEDISKGSCTVSGIQKPIKDSEWDKERAEYKKWFLDIFKQVDVPISKITDRQDEQEHKAWTINYFPGGWQAGHFHSTRKTDQSNKRFCSSVCFSTSLLQLKRIPLMDVYTQSCKVLTVILMITSFILVLERLLYLMIEFGMEPILAKIIEDV